MRPLAWREIGVLLLRKGRMCDRIQPGAGGAANLSSRGGQGCRSGSWPLDHGRFLNLREGRAISASSKGKRWPWRCGMNMNRAEVGYPVGESPFVRRHEAEEGGFPNTGSWEGCRCSYCKALLPRARQAGRCAVVLEITWAECRFSTRVVELHPG